MDSFIVKDGKRLRLGYTTGTCAAAAAKAAALMLLGGFEKNAIHLTTPSGIELDLPILEISRNEISVSCAVRKDSGDDPDVTNGALIFASVTRISEKEIQIEGGKGVGRVTKPGLDQPVGAAAINSVPRKMIRENLEEICRLLDYQGGLSVLISVPEGEKIAKRTFNPRLGIEGGISIIGTSGIVEPMSDRALIETIRIELNQRKTNGEKQVILTPGNYGVDFLQNTLGIDPKHPVLVSNIIGDALDICKELGFSEVLLVGHIGKLVKIAVGMMNTHSRYGDCRMEIIAAHAAASGISSLKVREILNCVTCDEALRITKEENVFFETMSRISKLLSIHINQRTQGSFEVETIIFSKLYGQLAESSNARQFLNKFRRALE